MRRTLIAMSKPLPKRRGGRPKLRPDDLRKQQELDRLPARTRTHRIWEERATAALPYAREFDWLFGRGVGARSHRVLLAELGRHGDSGRIAEAARSVTGLTTADALARLKLRRRAASRRRPAATDEELRVILRGAVERYARTRAECSAPLIQRVLADLQREIAEPGAVDGVCDATSPPAGAISATDQLVPVASRQNWADRHPLDACPLGPNHATERREAAASRPQ